LIENSAKLSFTTNFLFDFLHQSVLLQNAQRLVGVIADKELAGELVRIDFWESSCTDH
jgi:hypothetical protein